MAETPLTDSIEALTTYANQVTGASDTNLSDAVYTLAQGYGGGGVNPPLVVEEIVVGENTVSNMVEAHDYFFSGIDNNQILILKGTANTLNQLESQYGYNNSGSIAGDCIRYRASGVFQFVQLNNMFDCVLVPGTTYYKIYKQ